MNFAYNLNAPKKPLNLSINTDLVTSARQFTDNLSSVMETLLAKYVAEKVNARDRHAEALNRAAGNWNSFIEKHGSFADEHSTL